MNFFIAVYKIFNVWHSLLLTDKLWNSVILDFRHCFLQFQSSTSPFLEGTYWYLEFLPVSNLLIIYYLFSITGKNSNNTGRIRIFFSLLGSMSFEDGLVFCQVGKKHKLFPASWRAGTWQRADSGSVLSRSYEHCVNNCPPFFCKYVHCSNCHTGTIVSF